MMSHFLGIASFKPVWRTSCTVARLLLWEVVMRAKRAMTDISVSGHIGNGTIYILLIAQRKRFICKHFRERFGYVQFSLISTVFILREAVKSILQKSILLIVRSACFLFASFIWQKMHRPRTKNVGRRLGKGLHGSDKINYMTETNDGRKMSARVKNWTKLAGC